MRAVFALLFLLTACAGGRPPGAVGPALWQVRSAGSTVYLFGTMHVLPRPVPWLSPATAALFAGSREVWFEADLAHEGDMRRAILARASGGPGYDLSARLPAEEWRRLSAILASCGMAGDRLAHLYPWAANLALQSCALHRSSHVAAGTRPPIASTPDLALAVLAQREGKTVKHFESWDDQLDVFARLPDSVHLTMLRTELEGEPHYVEPGTVPANPEEIEARWLAGDVASIARMTQLAQEMGGKDLYRSVLTTRNARFAEAIAGILQRPTVAFVAIGAAHFAGSDNVVDQLRARGFDVTRLQ